MSISTERQTSARKENVAMSEPLEFMQNMNTRQFLLSTIRSLLPSVILSIACTLIIYNLLRPHFPLTSIIPLLIASLCPIFGNIVSIVRHRQLDIFGVMVLLGIAVSIIGVLLGGGPQLLLIRESFVTGAVGLALLVSLVLPKPLGYYFARQLLTGNDPQKRADFDAFWQHHYFRRGIQGGTIFWSLLLLTEFALRVVLVFTLPIILVLAISPIVFNALIVGGIAVSAIWGRNLIRHIHEMRP
jgi:hypothetical protein